jgi:hypothetical protein
MSIIAELSTSFSNLIRNFEYPLDSWGISYICVLSVRPILPELLGEKIIWANDYNHLNSERLRDKVEEKRVLDKEKRDKKERRRRERVIHESNKFPVSENFSIEKSYYHVLSELNDNCERFNKENDSEISPISCVKQITGIVGKKHVERLNFNDIIRENAELIRKTKKFTRIRSTID